MAGGSRRKQSRRTSSPATPLMTNGVPIASTNGATNGSNNGPSATTVS
ncbi:MAG: hypothetical protein KME45_28420 [Stenomitos rutilans HA7619-LM2]|nr:hypothetical protein [Stenomitos rutilans HA7619-LM2]